MSGFTLLWQKILDSSVWMTDAETRLVWITLLAMKDSEGKVYAVPSALAHRARVSVEGCQRALETFLAPDPESGNKSEEGRRLRVIEGGWQVINHDLYRFSTDAKREFWREQKRLQRERKGKSKGKKSKTRAQVHAEYMGRENRWNNAETTEQKDAICSEGLDVDNQG